MSLKIGVIGTGAIGKEHIQRLTYKLSGAEVVGVYDLYKEAAASAVEQFSLEARVYDNEDELVNSPEIDAIVIASLGEAHKATLLKGIEAGKYIFCEKPFTTTAKDSKEVVEAEMKKGKRLIQVGFNRRYDTGYEQLKRIIDSKEIGEPLLANCRHYNATVPEYYTTEMCVRDTLIHEIDIMHYLLNDKYKSVEMFYARKNGKWPREEPRDPQIFHIETETGIAIVVEVFVTDKYGYDIQCRVVGEEGIVSLPEVSSCEVRKDGAIRHSLFMDWKDRFIDAYDRELQAFINNILAKGAPGMPTAWDGYVASVASDSCVEAQQNPGKKILIDIADTPDFYKL